MWKKILNLLKTTYARATFRGNPSPECWAFSSVHNRTFNYNSSYLFLYVREHCPDIHPYYVIEDAQLRQELARQYGEEYFIDTGTLEGIRKVLRCKVWFTSTAPPLYGMGFRKKYVIVNLWHGVPLKKIGMEQENLSRLTRAYYKYLFADNYEAVLTTSQQLVPLMSRSFLVEPDRVKVWGQPRNDMLFRKQNPKEALEKVYGTVEEFEKVILYAPTFRDHAPTRLFPFQEIEADGVISEEGIEKLQSWLVQKKLLLCVRLHLYDQTANAWIREQDRWPGSRIRLLNEDRVGDIMEILNVFDLLITDYSSIYIDYLFTGKPVMFLPYDQEEYLRDRGMNFDYEKVTPGPKPKTFDEFLNSAEHLLYNIDSYVQQREKVHGFFNEVQRPCCGDICKYTRELIRRK